MKQIRPRFRILFRFVLIAFALLFFGIFITILLSKLDSNSTIVERFLHLGFFVVPFIGFYSILLLLIPIGGIAVNRVTKNVERMKVMLIAYALVLLA